MIVFVRIFGAVTKKPVLDVGAALVEEVASWTG